MFSKKSILKITSDTHDFFFCFSHEQMIRAKYSFFIIFYHYFKTNTKRQKKWKEKKIWLLFGWKEEPYDLLCYVYCVHTEKRRKMLVFFLCFISGKIHSSYIRCLHHNWNRIRERKTRKRECDTALLECGFMRNMLCWMRLNILGIYRRCMTWMRYTAWASCKQEENSHWIFILLSENNKQQRAYC